VQLLQPRLFLDERHIPLYHQPGRMGRYAHRGWLSDLCELMHVMQCVACATADMLYMHGDGGIARSAGSSSFSAFSLDSGALSSEHS
jgi:hypothetical protein